MSFDIDTNKVIAADEAHNKIPILEKICRVTNSIKILLETGFFTDKLTAGKASFLLKVLAVFFSKLLKFSESLFTSKFWFGKSFLFSIGIYFYVQHEVLEAVGLEFGGHDH